MRYYLQVLGCPKNLSDAEMIVELLLHAGHRRVSAPGRADVLLVLTCGFIAPAREESYQALRELATRKARGQRLVAAGCLAQSSPEGIRKAVPSVDAIIGTRSWSQVAALFSQLASASQGVRMPDLLGDDGSLVASVPRHSPSRPTAYLKIADGCSASCTFCAIPLIKGPQRSKPRDDILREVRELVAAGVREIVLIAQDTTAYGLDRGERDALPDLLRGIIHESPGLGWLRLLYAYPQHVTPRLIESMASLPQVCHYLDIPLQHGHPEVLRRMRRPDNLEGTLALLAGLRAAMPDVALRTSFIVGFPGETEAEFEGLLDFMRVARMDKVGVFPYSVEEGTPAALLPDKVPSQVIQERFERAMSLQQGISRECNLRQVGRELDVLVEGSSSDLSVGRCYRDAPEIDGVVLIPAKLRAGDWARVRVVSAQEYDLVAETCKQALVS